MKTRSADIRFAEPGDAALLAEIHASAWRNAYDGLIPFRSLNAMLGRRTAPWWENAVARHAAILVAEFGGRPVGYATLGRNRTPAIAAGGEIYELYLRPEYQGVGFGRRLFDASRELLAERSLRGLAVWALAENARAVGFYEALGGLDVAEGSECFENVQLAKIAFRWN